MKNQKIKMLLHLLAAICLSFVLIYLFVFLGGWKLLESGNPILIELAAAIIMGFVFWALFEVTKSYEAKLKELERRIEALEEETEIP